MKSISKTRFISWNVVLTVMAASFLFAFPLFMITSAAGDDPPILRRTANLAEPGGAANPFGFADYEEFANGERDLDVDVNNLTLPTGTVVTFFLNGEMIGQSTVQADDEVELDLDTEDGATVPVVAEDDVIEARDGETVLVTGVYGAGTGGGGGGGGGGTPTPSPSPGDDNEIYALLSGDTIGGVLPRGYAEFEIEDDNETEFEVELDNVNLPAGTQLDVRVDGNIVGSMLVESDRDAELELESDEGQTVPPVSGGTVVEVLFEGNVILSGEFADDTNPTPTPTPGEQGRSFEADLEDNFFGFDIPSEGDLWLTLNADETEATINGNFNSLTSNQTSAVINSTVGDTTTQVFDIGVVGGTNGVFETQTFSVTPEQVVQLRTGLWTAEVGTENNPAGEIGGVIRFDNDTSDFDGDGNDDFSLFRPTTGTWYTLNSNGVGASTFGTAADKPVSADFDGDGKTDTAIFKNSNGSAIWEIKHSSDGGTTSLQFGLASDIPVRADFDGDSINDIAVFRPSTGVWYIRNSGGAPTTIVQFGAEGDVPTASDFDGDGKADIGVFRPSNGVWYRINSSDNQVKIDKWGIDGDVPQRGDFDGDGRDDLAVYRPSNGVWYIFRSSDSNYDIAQFGTGDDIPVAGRYNNNGRTDIAVFRPSTGVWYIYNSVDQSFSSRRFGLTGDIPTITQ